MSLCNFCNLKNERAYAKKIGHTLRVVTPLKFKPCKGSAEILRHPKGIRLPKEGTSARKAFHKKYSVAWYMELSSVCCCSLWTNTRVSFSHQFHLP